MERMLLEYVYSVDLPRPPEAVRANARVHWARRAEAVRSARALAHLRVLNELGVRRGEVVRNGLYGYRVVWYYKGVRPDVDNCLSACKAYLDGCADAVGANDRDWALLGVDVVHDKARAGRVRLEFYGLCKPDGCAGVEGGQV